MPGAVPPVEYGVVVVTANTGGATVMLDGTPVTTPGQLVVPLDGVERTVDVMAPGFKTKQEKVSFSPGTKSVTLNVTLEPG